MAGKITYPSMERIAELPRALRARTIDMSGPLLGECALVIERQTAELHEYRSRLAAEIAGQKKAGR